MTYKIKTGEIKPNKRGRKLKYPFPDMEVGQFFTVKSKSYSALTAANKWAKYNNNGWKFSGSLTKGTLTVSRTQ